MNALGMYVTVWKLTVIHVKNHVSILSTDCMMET